MPYQQVVAAAAVEQIGTTITIEGVIAGTAVEFICVARE